jgi:hypothetical protein
MHENDKQKQTKKLTAAIAKVRDTLAAAERDDLAARHQVAVIVLDVKDTSKYGENAIERVEEEIGFDRATLYRYARVAEVWATKEFKDVSARTNSKGMPLSWSHWELLATLDDGRSRKSLVERSFKEALSVRALQLAIGEMRHASRRDGDEAKLQPSPVLDLSKKVECSATITLPHRRQLHLPILRPAGQ